MPGKKKSDAKKQKKEEEASLGPDADPAVLLSNYNAVSSGLGLRPNEKLQRTLSNGENPNQGKQIIIDGGRDETDDSCPLNPGACRALSLALLGRLPEAAINPEGGIVYTALKELRLWRCNVGDDGAAALAQYLRLGGEKVQLTFFELLNCTIQELGALSLGRALCCGMNKSLVTLMLDFNTKLGSRGIAALCRGLRTNSTLQKLSVQHCGIDAAGGAPVGEMLSFSKSVLKTLDMAGNHLGGSGLLALCSGFQANSSLTTLRLADNNIMSNEVDVSALEAFGTALAGHKAISSVDLLHNPIETAGGTALLTTLGKRNKGLTSLKVDTSLESNLYKALFRSPSSGKKGKKGGAKKKKKKK